MVMWRIRSCPKCGGDIYIEVEGDTLLDHCLQCSYIKPRMNKYCPQCGYAMHFYSEKENGYFYCTNCGHNANLRKMAN